MEAKANDDVNTANTTKCICPRKRKEHDDVPEHDVKFSKSSPAENPVSAFMKKWAQAPVSVSTTPEIQISSSAKENINPHETYDEPSEEAYNKITVNGRFSIYETESMSLSEKHMAFNSQRSEKQSSRGSPRSKCRPILKKLSLVKTKIESCEEAFKMKKGYRPSYADKMKDEDLNLLINEQSDLKKELKRIKETAGEETVKRSSIDAAISIEDQKEQIESNLATLRRRKNRPFELSQMSQEQLADEKQDMQTQLAEFEKMHKNQLNKEDKEIMNSLFERYRQVRRLSRRTSDLVPIPEEETINLTLASPKRRLSEDFIDNTIKEDEFYKISRTKGIVFEAQEERITEEDWHTLSFSELKTQLRRLRELRRNVKKKITEFEESEERKTNRNLEEDESTPMEETYIMYRATKSKIRLIKALMEKHEQ